MQWASVEIICVEKGGERGKRERVKGRRREWRERERGRERERERGFMLLVSTAASSLAY